MFISEPHAGQIYIAERSRKGSSKLLWSVMPELPPTTAAGYIGSPDIRIEPQHVPLRVRRRAYKMFEGDRRRS